MPSACHGSHYTILISVSSMTPEKQGVIPGSRTLKVDVLPLGNWSGDRHYVQAHKHTHTHAHTHHMPKAHQCLHNVGHRYYTSIAADHLLCVTPLMVQVNGWRRMQTCKFCSGDMNKVQVNLWRRWQYACKFCFGYMNKHIQLIYLK